MSETIIIENGEVKVEQQQPAPAPVKTNLAHALKQIVDALDRTEQQIPKLQAQLDRICSQLTVEHWETLVITQIRLIAVRSTDAQNYLKSIGQ